MTILKKILVGAGIALLVLVFLFGGVATWALLEKNRYDDLAVPYIKKVLPEISSWRADDLIRRLDERAMDGVSEAQIEKIVGFFSKLGSLQTMGEPEFQNMTSTANALEEDQKLISYRVPVQFESGDAVVKMTLIDREGLLSIHTFNIESMVLLE